MSTALKDLYNEDFYTSFTSVFKEVDLTFNPSQFLNSIFTSAFDQMELKQRMSHTSVVFHNFLSGDYEKDADTLKVLVDKLQEKGYQKYGLEYMFLPEYVAMYGLNHLETSIQLMERITQFTSCEFAVRPFILKHPNEMLKQMLAWSTHENHHVRRFASEGARPRLPWAMALPDLKKDPSPLLPILENLKHDESEYVRRSVANNLNDIAKDNPAITLKLSKKWFGKTKETDALVKHGCRTLLKAGEPNALALFGYDSKRLDLLDFSVKNPQINMGDRLTFDLNVKNNSNTERIVRLEYVIHLLKKNGEHSKKVFKISERNLGAGETLSVNRQHHFKPITTRVYYTGLHKVSVVLNGKEFNPLDFNLTV